MASNYSKFTLGIETTVDLASLQKLKTELQQVRAIADHAEFGFDAKQINDIIHSANTLENALTSAFDVDLNTINIEKFNKYIKQSGLSLSQIQKDLASTGPAGQQAFLTATSSLLKMNTALKQTNKFLDDIATSFGNTVRWTIMSSIVNNISSTIQQSYYYVKDLDSGLNDIRIVTGKSADEMERFAIEANNAAKALAVSTKDYTEGSLIYYQQGLDDETVKTLTDITAMTSNVTGQSMETVSEQLTAVWNGYQVANQAAEEGMGVYQEYVDKMAAVGAATASDLQELATAMSKVASAANAMGVDFDQLSAQIATIVSVTRQAPESVGTALKTIYARIGDLKVDGVDEFGTTLGEVSSNLAKVGIEVVDTNGEMRDIGQVMEEVAAKWDTWNESQQQAIAISIAGKRQYNNLLALFENWDMYTDTLDTAANAAGTLNKQQEIALESINNKMDILKATAEDLYDNLFDEESIKDIIDALTVLLQSLADTVDALGGLKTILPMLGSLGVKVFSKQISGSVTTFLTNIKVARQETENMQKTAEKVKEIFSDSSIFKVENAGSKAAAESLQDITGFYDEFSKSQQLMTQAQKEEYNEILQQKVALGEKKIQLEDEYDTWKSINNQLGIFNDEIINSPKNFTEISGELNNINQLVRRISDETVKTFVTSNNFSEATMQLTNYLHTLGLSDDSIYRIQQRFKELLSSGNNINEAMDILGRELNELGEQSNKVRNLNQEAETLGHTLNTAGQRFKENFDLDTAIRNVSGMIAGLGQLASSLSMLKNFADIWNDETLSSWEKTLQIIINLTMILPMFGGGIKSLIEGVGSLPVVLNNLTVILSKLTGEAATSALAVEGMGSSLLQFLKAVRLSLSSFAPYIIALSLVSVAIYGLIKAYNKKADALKEAIKTEDELRKQLDKTKESYNNLINEIEDYNKAQLAISELTEGTKEWAEAIETANQKVLELVEKYPELAKYIKTLNNGQLILDNSNNEVSDFLENEQNNITKAKVATYVANIGTNEASLDAEFEKFSRKTGITDISQDFFNPIFNNPEEYSKMFSQYSEAFQEVQDALLNEDQAKHDAAKNKKDKIVQQMVDFYKNAGLDISQSLAENLLYEYDNVIDVKKLINSNKSKKEGSMILATDAFLRDSKYNDKYQSPYQNQLKNLITNKTEENFKIQKEEYNKKTLNDIQDEYKRFRNLSSEEFEALDITEEQMRKELAYNKALEDATANNFDSYYNALVNLTQEGIDAGISKGFSMTEAHETGQLLASFLGGDGDLSMATQEQVNALQRAVHEGFNIDKEVLESAGYNNAKEFIDAIQKKIDEYRTSGRGAEVAELLKKEAEAAYQKDLSETAKELDVSKEALEGYTEALMTSNEGLEENAEAAVAAAESNINFAKGVEKLQKALDDNLNILKAWDDTAFETFEAASEVQEAIKEMFGVDVSANFVKNKDNLEDLQKVLKGDEEAIDRLAYAAAQDFVIGLNLDETGTNALQNAIDTLNNLDISIGANVDLGNSIDEINKLLEAGELTVEQVNQAFGSVGFKPNIDYTTAWGPYLETETEIYGEDGVTVIGNNKTRSRSEIAVPYITSSTTESQGDNSGVGIKNSGSSATSIGNGTSRSKIAKTASLKNKKDDKSKKIEDEIDRYWELNKALEAVTETISDLDKLQSHLHGKELINSLEKENELLEEQANRYKAINAEQMREADELRQKLANTYAVSFDANGGIANYAEATTRMLNWYNNNLDDEVAQKSYDNFKKLLERYETLYYEEMVDVQNQLDDIFYQQLENNLKAWETDLEINLELEEAEREWSDFTKAMQDDFKKVYRDINRDFTNIMDKMATYGDDGTINLDIKAIQDVVREIEKFEAGGQSDMFASISEAQEKLKELQGTLMDDAEAVHDLWVEAWEAYLEGIDQAADKFDDLMEKFDTINEELDFQRELTELLYGDKMYNIFGQIYDSQLNNSMTQIKSLKQQISLWEELYKEAEEGSEEQLKYHELLQDAQSQLNDKTLEHIKLLKEEYSNTVSKIIDDLSKSLTGDLGFDKMSEEWAEAKATADKYFDSTERLYELETIANKYNEAISNTSSLENQQKLKDLMDGQLANLNAKEKLTEYDITLAEKRLSIAQAEMALEDAKNAKNSMKLVRGANGNWEYQYVADENDIANKQQQLLDTYKNLYDYVKKTEEESIDSIMNMTEKYFKELSKLEEEFVVGSEEYQEAVNNLYDEYWNEDYGKISILQREHAQYEKDLNQANAEFLWGLYQTNEENYNNMTENEKAIIDSFKEHSINDYIELHDHINTTYDEIQSKLEETLKYSLETWNSAAHDMAAAWNADDGESVRAQVLNAMDQITQAAEDYQIKVDEVAGAVGEDFSEDGIKGAIDDATSATNMLQNATTDLCNSARSALSDYRGYVKQVEDAWLAVYKQARAALEMSQKAAAAAGKEISYSNSSSSVGSYETSFNPDGNTGNQAVDDNSGGGGEEGVSVPLYVSPAGGHKDTITLRKGEFSTPKMYRPGAQEDKDKWPYYYYLDTNSNLDGYINEATMRALTALSRAGKDNNFTSVNKFDTGGYTGDWAGGNGRIAMLHKKELVLNKTDTKNILDTVNTIRDLGSVTSSISSAIINTIKNMVMDVMGIKAGGTYSKQQTETPVNNTYEIHAEFPNANDVTSIREAILSLPNLASQYTSQNKK